MHMVTGLEVKCTVGKSLSDGYAESFSITVLVITSILVNLPAYWESLPGQGKGCRRIVRGFSPHDGRVG